MFKFMDFKMEKIALFLGGVLFGTVGIKALSSKEAKKLYVKGAVIGLEAKDYVMKTTCCIKENAEDILAEAKLKKEEKEKNTDEVFEEIENTDEI